MIDDPNVLIINSQREKPDDIIEDYFEMIIYFKDDRDAILSLLREFFDDVNFWTVKQFLIDSAKNSLSQLELLDKLEHEFIDDSDE